MRIHEIFEQIFKDGKLKISTTKEPNTNNLVDIKGEIDEEKLIQNLNELAQIFHWELDKQKNEIYTPSHFSIEVDASKLLDDMDKE